MPLFRILKIKQFTLPNWTQFIWYKQATTTANEERHNDHQFTSLATKRTTTCWNLCHNTS